MVSTYKKEGLEAKPFIHYLPIVIACVMFAFVPTAMQTSCNGIFLPELGKDYGVPTSQISIYLTIGNLTAAVFAPIIGQLLARFDVRAITTIMLLGAAGSFFSLSISASLIQVWVSGALMTGFCTSFVGLVNPTILTRWFKDLKGTMIGIAAAFTGFGGVVFIPIGQSIISMFGYREAYLAYAVLILILCLPGSLLILRSHPHDRGMLPYMSEKRKAGLLHEEKPGMSTWTVDPSIAMKNPAFYLLGLATGILGWCLLLNPHFPTYVGTLEAAGINVIITGAMLATLVSGSQGIGKLVLGALSDKSPMKTIVFAGCLGAFSVLAIWWGPTTLAMPLGTIAFGFFFATSAVLMPMLAGSVFGTGENYSIILGRSQTITKLITAPGAMVWPFLAENAGGWGTVFGCVAVLIVIVVLCSWLVRYFGSKIPHIPVDAEGNVINQK